MREQQGAISLLKIVCTLLVTAASIWLAIRQVDLQQVWNILAAASPGLILLAGLLSLVMNAVKCNKLGVLLSHLCKLRWRSLFAAEMISVMVDIIFPFRLVELVRAYIVGRKEGIPASLVLGAEVVEKGVEILYLLVMMFLLSLIHPLPWWLVSTGWGGLGAAVLGISLLALLVVRPRSLERPVSWLGELSLLGAAGLSRVMKHLLEGMLAAAVRPSSLALVLLLTLVEWGLLAATLWVAALALTVRLTVGELLGVLVTNFVAFAVPISTTGSVGIYEFVGLTTLVQLFAMPPEQALGLVLVFHFVMTVFGLVGGVMGLVLARVSLSRIREDLRDEGLNQGE